jgi:hypothetical protein
MPAKTIHEIHERRELSVISCDLVDRILVCKLEVPK